jgi:dimethylargininase
MVQGITSHPELGKPDYVRALAQHDAYIKAMESLGVKVRVLPADESYPDSCFVEDVAVVSEKCAVVTNPGAPSRNAEIKAIIPVLEDFWAKESIHRISAPGTLEGGDVMRVENTFYAGLSERTNAEGIRQFTAIMERYGYKTAAVPLTEVLHLKTGVNYLDGNKLLVTGEFITKQEFASFDKIVIPREEDYAANCLWINGTVILPAGFPKTEAIIRRLGWPVLPVDTAEFRKLDGGLSCLSLRF